MKSLLRKSFQLSFASIVAIKGSDLNKKYELKQRLPIFRNVMTYAEEEDNQEDEKFEKFLEGLNPKNVAKYEFDQQKLKGKDQELNKYNFVLKSRDEHLKDLMDEKNVYDILVIGGGASGAGVALEAASRGLKCAVVEKFDFASGTSSRSTKMAHGGIRYFEKMMKLDGDPFENYALLKETLHERNYFLHAAPFQNKPLKLVIPSPSFFATAFFYYPGALLYHLMYVKELFNSDYVEGLSGPRIMGKGKVCDTFKKLKAIHGQYGVAMYETQMMDTRMNILTLLTSTIDKYVPSQRGSTLANYCEFVDFLKNAETGKIEGAILKDTLKNKQFKVRSRVVVNCAGIHADELRIQDNPKALRRVTGARGTHLMFSKDLLPENSGIIIPKTKDGRLIFIINYLGHAMVGTTDDKCELTHTPKPDPKDIEFIVSELRQIFGEDFDYDKNLQSAWAGIRPLVIETEEDKQVLLEQQRREDSTILRKLKRRLKHRVIRLGIWIHGEPKGSTANLSRNHVIEVNEKSGLVSLMGGKWTSFRKMGEETINKILESNIANLNPKNSHSISDKFKLIGAYSAAELALQVERSPEEVQTQYEEHLIEKYDISEKSAAHLYHSYGTAAVRVLELGKQQKLNQQLHESLPYLKSEVLYAARFEMAEKPNDVVCRRVPIGVVNQEVAQQVLKEVVDIMAKEKRWGSSQKQAELKEALENLQFIK